MERVSVKRIDGYAHEVSNGRHTFVSDESPEVGGADRGPAPTELLAMSLAACTAATVEMYADRKAISLPRLEVEVDYELHPREGGSEFHVALKLPRGLTEEQVERLRVIAGKCPVHRVLMGDSEIKDRIQILPDDE